MGVRMRLGLLAARASIRSVGKIVLGSILDAAVENRRVDTNPVVKAKVPHNRAVQRRIYLTPQEIKIPASQMDEANATVIYLLAYAELCIGGPPPCDAWT